MRQYWLCIVLLLAACTNNDKVPSGIIQRPEMEKIMWDMIRADRYAGIFLASDTVHRKQRTFELYANVFNLHHITQEEFLKSYKFYLGRPDIAKTMFDSIAARAERQRADLYKPLKDSVAGGKDSASSRYREALRDSARRRMDSLRSRSKVLSIHDSVRRRRDSVLKVRANASLKNAPKK